jgi:hypothetical protein
MLNKKKKNYSIDYSFIRGQRILQTYTHCFIDDIGQIEQMSIDIFIRKAKKNISDEVKHGTIICSTGRFTR